MWTVYNRLTLQPVMVCVEKGLALEIAAPMEHYAVANDPATNAYYGHPPNHLKAAHAGWGKRPLCEWDSVRKMNAWVDRVRSACLATFD